MNGLTIVLMIISGGLCFKWGASWRAAHYRFECISGRCGCPAHEQIRPVNRD